MIRTTMLAVATFAFLATPALAGHCPKDARAIDAGLAKSSASADEKKKISVHRDEGMKLHSGGKHRQSEAKLDEAMRMLLTAE